MKSFELQAINDHHKSFGGKAHVLVYDDGAMELYSYDTLVARINADGSVDKSVEKRVSQTTNRHIKEFYLQFAK